MRTIIAGSRTVKDIRAVQRAVVESGFSITEVVSGHASGVDRLGEMWAMMNGVHCSIYPALWSKYGKRAGLIRNELMAENADSLIAVWDGKSTGTKHMIMTAMDRGLQVHVFLWEGE